MPAWLGDVITGLGIFLAGLLCGGLAVGYCWASVEHARADLDSQDGGRA